MASVAGGLFQSLQVIIEILVVMSLVVLCI
jgi:hypothetical protein